MIMVRLKGFLVVVVLKPSQRLTIVNMAVVYEYLIYREFHESDLITLILTLISKAD